MVAPALFQIASNRVIPMSVGEQAFLTHGNALAIRLQNYVNGKVIGDCMQREQNLGPLFLLPLGQAVTTLLWSQVVSCLHLGLYAFYI